MYEGYTHTNLMLRRKVFAFLGKKFHIYGPEGNLLFFVKQKAFKLKEDIRVFTDENRTTEVLRIKARGVIDFGMTYDVFDTLSQNAPPEVGPGQNPYGTHAPQNPELGLRIGAFRRKGLKSILRDEWHILDLQDQQIGKMQEDSMGLALVRRFLSNLVPQSFTIDIQMQKVMELRQRFNPFIAKVDIDFSHDHQGWMDRRMGIAAAVLMGAIEGRQG
ncbi:hypothetical protein OAU50_01265 [Planctomycetota bacterium]|nr:hypothetical protein [Planctomycetota bacterium]